MSEYQVEMTINPAPFPEEPIAVGPVVVTADTIKTAYMTIPNFGGHATLTPAKSGAWSDPETWTRPGQRAPARVALSERDPLEDCCD